MDKMTDKSVIIIGGGIAGLAAGSYVQMNGYKSTIFEMHDKPGGLCTAWQRKGYTIDGCLRWLWGSAPSSTMYKLWEEMGIVQGKTIIDMDLFYRFENLEGKVFNLYNNIDKLEQEMLEIAPEDMVFIQEVTGTIRKFMKFDPPPGKAPELYSAMDGLKMLFTMAPFLGNLRKWGRMSIQDFAGHFTNPFLRQCWEMVWEPGMSALFILLTIANLHQKAAGYIIGGSMEITRSAEKRYLGLGGEIKYKSRVDKILVENGRDVGIRLMDGSEYRADYVVSAADGHSTIFEMLEGKYIDNKIEKYFREYTLFNPLIYVGLGVNRSFNDVPQLVSGLVYELKSPVTIANTEQKCAQFHLYNFDDTFAAQGKSVITMMLETDYDYWVSLRKDMTRYKEEKQRIAETVISMLNERFPGVVSQVEMHDVATPVTFTRYTGNWQGSYEGWLITPDNYMVNMSKTLPGLDSFYMAGHWVMPGGGLPLGVMSGRHAAQLICHRDKKEFVTTIP
jgi:phytoene dehydrogenase-like protein